MVQLWCGVISLQDRTEWCLEAVIGPLPEDGEGEMPRGLGGTEGRSRWRDHEHSGEQGCQGLPQLVLRPRPPQWGSSQ